ncbi:MAG: transglutaminase domain-containing protein [Brotaphodocola sp.]
MLKGKRIIAAAVFVMLLQVFFFMEVQAETWDTFVAGYLGVEEKQELEKQAQAAAAENEIAVYWTIPEDENGNPISGVNDGIPTGAVFYSSQDLIWQPVAKQVVYPNSVHQTGGETGSVFVSWNNGRGRLFTYTKERYQSIMSELHAFCSAYTWVGMSDFEKEMQIVQYLTANVSYPYHRYMAGQDTSDDHSVYGALVLGEAVCEGYTEAFCWLADACGLETRFITGSYNGTSHSWAMVKLDGHWYHVDVTADDIIIGGSSVNGYGWGNLLNRYINRTDQEFAKDHIWEPLEDAACVTEFYGPNEVEAYLKRNK